MRPQEIKIPDEVDERLKEWGRFFRDRHRLQRCQSIEGRFNAHAPGSWDEGWGDPEAVPAYLPPVVMPRVLRTHECVSELPRAGKWAITLGYCYPGLNRYLVLKIMRKYSGRRFTWNKYLDELELARVRIWSCISFQWKDLQR